MHVCLSPFTLPSPPPPLSPQYKYQINIDGTVAAYRFPYLLAGGSLVLKQDSSYYEHFYHKTVPWEHYVPVRGDLSDLLDQVEWAKAEDKHAEEIAANSAQFVRDNLLPDHLYCYMIRLLQVCGVCGHKEEELGLDGHAGRQGDATKWDCVCVFMYYRRVCIIITITDP